MNRIAAAVLVGTLGVFLAATPAHGTPHHPTPSASPSASPSSSPSPSASPSPSPSVSPSDPQSTPPSVQPSPPATTVVDGQTLPVTGTTANLVLGACALLILGGALVYVVRRKTEDEQ